MSSIGEDVEPAKPKESAAENQSRLQKTLQLVPVPEAVKQPAMKGVILQLLSDSVKLWKAPNPVKQQIVHIMW